MNIEQALEDAAFALKRIKEVSVHRKNERALAACTAVEGNINRFSPTAPDGYQRMAQLLQKLYGIASDLRIAIKYEMHEVLVPFLQVKEPTHAFGKEMFPDYFRWLPDDTKYPPQELVTIMEEDAHTLDIAIEHLDRAHNSHSVTYRGRHHA